MSASLWMSADSDLSSSQRYPEVAEIEVNFLVENFSGSVRKDFDEMLRMVVLGTKGHCFRVLAFTIKRLSGDNTQSAWASVDGTEGQSMFGSREEAGGGNSLGEMANLNSEIKLKIREASISGDRGTGQPTASEVKRPRRRNHI